MTDTLIACRQEIDQLDRNLLQLLGQRFEICRLIASHKFVQGMPMKQPVREQEIQGRNLALAREYNLDPEFVDRLFQLILSASVDLEIKPENPGNA